MEQSTEININTLLKNIVSYNKEADLDLVKKAYQFALDCHKGQKRKNGEDYIVHPFNVALKLSSMELDAPLAERLVIGRLKADLEDLAFSHSNQKEYENIIGITKEIFTEKEKYLKEMKGLLKTLLEKEEIKAE